VDTELAKMKKIQTILGPVPPEKLGVTDIHEHIIVDGGLEALMIDWDFNLPSVEKAIEEVTYFHKAGGNSIVDYGMLGAGRRITKLLKVAEKVPVNIIATSGFFFSGIYRPGCHWVNVYSKDEIADLLVKEITEGMDANDYLGPIVKRLDAKAGQFKAASQYNFISKGDEKVFRSVAMAHLETGAPIATHTEKGTMALEQIEILKSEGVDPSRVTLAHLDRNPDFGYHKEIAETGAYLQYNGPSRIKYYPDSVYVDLIIRMVDAGFGKQILMGGDNGRATMWKSISRALGFSYILEKFVPRLREEGLKESAIQDILVNNPARFLAF